VVARSLPKPRLLARRATCNYGAAPPIRIFLTLWKDADPNVDESMCSNL
jgi:hypothetical protein